MKPNSKKKTSGKNASRSATKAIAPAKTRKVSAKKSALREEVIRVPARSGETDAATLFFDEADALFGKRTAVRDAHDRYANLTPKSRAQNSTKRTSGKAINRTNEKKKNAP